MTKKTLETMLGAALCVAGMTGMYATTIGSHNHRSHQNSYKFPMGDLYLPEGVKLLTDWMREAGYFTCNAKKFPTNAVTGTGKTNWNFNYRGVPFDSDNWEDLKSHQPFYTQVNFAETHTRIRLESVFKNAQTNHNNK